MMEEAIEAAKGAEVTVMVLGGNELTVREDRSRTSLDLPGRQKELLKKNLPIRQTSGIGND